MSTPSGRVYCIISRANFARFGLTASMMARTVSTAVSKASVMFSGDGA